MVSLWPRRMKCEPRGRSLSVAFNDLIHGAGHGAEVGSVDIGEDVEHGLHIVVAHRAQLRAGLDGSEVSEHLHGAGSARVLLWLHYSMAAWLCCAEAELVTGRLCNAATESSRYCGVWVATL